MHTEPEMYPISIPLIDVYFCSTSKHKCTKGSISKSKKYRMFYQKPVTINYLVKRLTAELD
jgi:hypothetical protein